MWEVHHQDPTPQSPWLHQRRLLSNALSGNSRTSMIGTLSPAVSWSHNCLEKGSWVGFWFVKRDIQIWDIYCSCCCVCICMCMCSVFVAVVFGSGKVQCTTMLNNVLLDSCQWHVSSLNFSSGYHVWSFSLFLMTICSYQFTGVFEVLWPRKFTATTRIFFWTVPGLFHPAGWKDDQMFADPMEGFLLPLKDHRVASESQTFGSQ